MQQKDEQMKRVPWNMAFLEVLQQDYDCLSSKNKSVLMLFIASILSNFQTKLQEIGSCVSDKLS